MMMPSMMPKMSTPKRAARARAKSGVLARLRRRKGLMTMRPDTAKMTMAARLVSGTYLNRPGIA